MQWIRRVVMLRAAEPELILRLRGGSRDHCPWERHKTLPNYYAELGVTTDANDKELRRAHKKMIGRALRGIREKMLSVETVVLVMG